MLEVFRGTVDVVATGKRIEGLRKRNGYSVAEIAHYLGFTTPQAVYKWQQGKCLPEAGNLIALSRLFGIHVEEIIIMSGAGDEPAPDLGGGCKPQVYIQCA